MSDQGKLTLPVGKREDVQYDPARADIEDIEAQIRAEAADERATEKA
ncbi:YfhD family protein [Brevibacillus sp. H7]